MARIGLGYDVHRFTENRKLMLGGVDVPSSLGLLGHSDADVLIHAVMDSLLSAAGLRDIGVYFPNTDPQYLAISSLVLLNKVYGKITEGGYRVGNISCVIICEKPKLSLYIDQMRQNIASVLQISLSEVGLSVTTNEGLGYIGRQEGISAQAICLLEEIK